MPIILCKVDMFSYIQHLKIVEDGQVIKTVSTPVDQLEVFVPQLCKEFGVTEVQLYGLADYLMPIGEGIKTNYNLHYATTKDLKVEVISNV